MAKFACRNISSISSEKLAYYERVNELFFSQVWDVAQCTMHTQQNNKMHISKAAVCQLQQIYRFFILYDSYFQAFATVRFRYAICRCCFFSLFISLHFSLVRFLFFLCASFSNNGAHDDSGEGYESSKLTNINKSVLFCYLFVCLGYDTLKTLCKWKSQFLIHPSMVFAALHCVLQLATTQRRWGYF